VTADPFRPPARVATRRRVAAFAIGAIGLVTSAWNPAPAAARDIDMAGPDAPIAALHQGLIDIMRMGKTTPFVARFNQLAPIIDQTFDLPTILRACVGLRWSGLSTAEQTALLKAFRTFTIASYVANFDEDSGDRFVIGSDIRSIGEDRVVPTSIVPVNGSAPTRIDYVMHIGHLGWQAIDVLLDGTISRVAVQRSDFRSLLADGDASALIDSLRHKVATMSDGAIPS
jgi:phospholipid transport system substrate-binding protein